MPPAHRLRLLGLRAGLLLAATALCLGAAEVVLRLRPATALGFEYRDGMFRGPREFEEDPARNR